MIQIGSSVEPEYLEVIKRSDNFYGVYKSWFNYAINGYMHELLTSATTKTQAHKKMKLIYKGYKMGENDNSYYDEY